MNKIRILHIGLSGNVGGIETVVKNWWDAIDREQFAFDFVNVEDRPLAFEEEFLSGGCKIYKIAARKSDPVKSWRQLSILLNENRYDFVHHHVMGITWPEPTILAGKIPGTVPVIHNHTVFGKNSGTARRLLNLQGHVRLLGRSYLKLACSYEAGNSVFPEGTFQVINNGIDYAGKKFRAADRDEIRARYHIPEDTVLIGHVGRACYEKNYPYLLKTVAELLKSKKNVKCMLVGDVNEDPSVLSLVESLGIKEHVIFTGKVRNTEKYASAFDLFFFPSIYEGVSVSVLEAQCSGLPCIVSRNISKETEISDLLTYIDIGDIKDGVRALSEAKLRSFEARSSVKLKPEFDIRRTVEDLMEFYRANYDPWDNAAEY